jgi:hypothetical protein
MGAESRVRLAAYVLVTRVDVPEPLHTAVLTGHQELRREAHAQA